MVMQTKRQQLNRIFASWVLAGFWFLALIGMSVLSSPYETSEIEAFALDGPPAHDVASVLAETDVQDS